MVPPLLQKFIWLTVASSFFVRFEPAPCDVLLGLTLIVAAAAGRHYVLPRAGFGIYASLFVLMLANLASLTFAGDPVYSLRFFSITAYVVASFLLFVGLIEVDGPKMITHLANALCAAALVAVVVGLLAQFHLIPNPRLFFRDEAMLRIRSTFKDPNVFSPFLVTAFMFSLSRVVDGGRRATLAAALMIPYAVGILLAFSRGAWVMLGTSLFVFLVAHVVVVRRQAALSRLTLAASLVPLVVVPVLVCLVVATDSSHYLAGRLGFTTYDTSQRFTNHVAAIQLGLENPLGIGPGMYSPRRGLIAVHSLYIRLFVENGAVGLVAFLCFLGCVVSRTLRGVLARGENAGTYAFCLAILMGILVESLVIDTLHWRHLFLVMAIPVGLWLHEARQAAEGLETDRPQEPDALAPVPVAGGSE